MPISGKDEMLEVRDLAAGYGDFVAVRNLSFTVKPGMIFALLGANGAGKSSTLMSLFGLVERKSGTIRIDGNDISPLPVESRIALGLAIVPEGRRIFPDLSVEENLIVGGHSVSNHRLRTGIETVFGYFPRLKERHKQAAGSLSGGEQQMLAIGRGLISGPKFLIVDELSLGLMPRIVDECYFVLNKLKAKDVGIILVEQNTERVFQNADEISILEAGNEIWTGSASVAASDDTIMQKLMGIR